MMNALILAGSLLSASVAFAGEVHLDEIQFASISNMATYSLNAPAEKDTKLNGFIPLTSDDCSIQIDRTQNGEIMISIGKSRFAVSQIRTYESATVVAPDFISLIERPESEKFKALQIRSTSDKSVVWFAIVERGQKSSITECSINP